MATLRPMKGSRPAYTTPMAPRPNSPVISNLPSFLSVPHPRHELEATAEFQPAGGNGDAPPDCWPASQVCRRRLKIHLPNSGKRAHKNPLASRAKISLPPFAYCQNGSGVSMGRGSHVAAGTTWLELLS